MPNAIVAPTLDSLISLGLECGAIVKRVYRDGSLAVKLKADKTLVTAADRGVHDLVVSWLSAYPGLVLVGEEGKLGTRTYGMDEHWLAVDELDGTHAYAMGIPVATVMIALMFGDVPVRSVIVDPFSERIYAAEKGAGATLNGKALRLASGPIKSPVVDVASWPHQGAYDMLIRDIMGVSTELHDMGCEVQAVGGIGIADARVASGEFHATVFPGYTWHDTPAGDLLVREAGGITSDLWGKPLRYDKTPPFGHVFAGNEELHSKIIEITRRKLVAQAADHYDPLLGWK